MKFHLLKEELNRVYMKVLYHYLPYYIKESLCCCLLFDKVVHPHSLKTFSNDTDLVNPVTKRAASFRSFCKVLVLFRAYIPYN